MECFKCGASDRNVRLFDVITREGIVKLCEKCASHEDSPIIRKPTTFQLKEIERRPTVYERLSRIAGLEPNERRTEKSNHLVKQETNLRAIVDKNYQERVRKEAKPRLDLIDNFYWIIMRARRSKHITQKQLAEAMGEAEAAVKMAEEGILPNDNDRLLNKIQSYLGINLLKNGIKLTENKPVFLSTKPLDFDRKNPNDLTISDLRRINEEREKNKENSLSEEEIDKILFRKE